jgi:hypothetical protein
VAEAAPEAVQLAAVAGDQQVQSRIVVLGGEERFSQLIDAVIGFEWAYVDQVDAGRRALAVGLRLHETEDRPRAPVSRDESGK